MVCKQCPAKHPGCHDGCIKYVAESLALSEDRKLQIEDHKKRTATVAYNKRVSHRKPQSFKRGRNHDEER